MFSTDIVWIEWMITDTPGQYRVVQWFYFSFFVNEIPKYVSLRLTLVLLPPIEPGRMEPVS